MNIINFIIRNWQDIIVVIIFVVGFATAITQWLKKIVPIFKNMTDAEKVAYVTRLLTNLVPIALVLVTDAEITWGGKTGQIKRSQVIGQLYSYIPDEYKKYVTEENLDAIIEKALEQAEQIWENNPNIRKLIKSGGVQ